MLLDLQRRFRDGLLAANAAPVADLIAGPASRFTVHHGNFAASLTDALEAAFPVVKRLVGEDFFRVAADRFLHRHPPTLPRLSAYGVGFPDFLAGFAPAASLPYLPDVARLEWARIDSYFGPGSDDRIDPARLHAVSESALPAMRFWPHPSLRLLTSPHPIATIWSLNQPQHATVPAIDLTRPEAARVLCAGRHVRVDALAPAGFAFLDALARGLPLAAAAAVVDPSFDLGAALLDALRDGALIGIIRSDEAPT